MELFGEEIKIGMLSISWSFFSWLPWPPLSFEDFSINRNFYIDTPSYVFIPNSPNCLVFGPGVCFVSVPPIYGFSCWESPLMLMFFFPNYCIFPYIFPTKIPPHPTTNYTTNHTTPSPTIPTTKPLHTPCFAQNNLGELFALLKFLWPDVMAKESEAWQGNQKSSWIYGCCGCHNLPQTNVAMESAYLFW